MPGRGQKELFEHLIREVRERECLYSVWHPSYKDRHVTEGQWEAVAVAMGMTVMDVKRLWGTLRSSYTRSVKTAMCSSVLQRRTAWYLEDEMSFLRPHLNLVMPGGKRLSPKRFPPGGPPSAPLSPYPPQGVKSEFPLTPPTTFGLIDDGSTDQVYIKTEPCSPGPAEKRELEEGEILPGDLINGSYWISPQFPSRISQSHLSPTENSELNSCPSECSKSSSPLCSVMKIDLNLSQASCASTEIDISHQQRSQSVTNINKSECNSNVNGSLNSTDTQPRPNSKLDTDSSIDMESCFEIFDERLRNEDNNLSRSDSQLNDSSPGHLQAKSIDQLDVGSPLLFCSQKRRQNNNTWDSKKDSDLLSKKLRPEDLIGDRSSHLNHSQIAFQTYKVNGFYKHSNNQSMPFDVKGNESSKLQNQQDTDFFKGIMPRFKELNRKNKRRFEAQTLQLLYSILDEQEIEGHSSN